MRRLAATLIVLLAAGAGCGAPSDAERQRDRYVQAVERERAALIAELGRIGDEAEPTGTPARDAAALAVAERAAARARERLSRAPVPPAAAAPHRELLAALRGYELALGRARRATVRARGDRVTAIRGALEDVLARRSRELDRAVAAIAAALNDGDGDG